MRFWILRLSAGSVTELQSSSLGGDDCPELWSDCDMATAWVLADAALLHSSVLIVRLEDFAFAISVRA